MNGMTLRRSKVGHHTGEGACTYCGCPLYVGDTAYDNDNGAYCTRSCARDHSHRVDSDADRSHWTA